MSRKRASVAQARSGESPEAVKISILMSPALKKRLQASSVADRRRLSPQAVTLLEEALAAREAQAATA